MGRYPAPIQRTTWGPRNRCVRTLVDVVYTELSFRSMPPHPLGSQPAPSSLNPDPSPPLCPPCLHQGSLVVERGGGVPPARVSTLLLFLAVTEGREKSWFKKSLVAVEGPSDFVSLVFQWDGDPRESVGVVRDQITLIFPVACGVPFFSALVRVFF